MKKKITITVECDTHQSDDNIKSKLVKGIYRAFDVSGSYIAPPNQISSMNIAVSDVVEPTEEVEEQESRGWFDIEKQVREQRAMDGHDDILGNPAY